LISHPDERQEIEPAPFAARAVGGEGENGDVGSQEHHAEVQGTEPAEERGQDQPGERPAYVTPTRAKVRAKPGVVAGSRK
jgi:hypothetical protein